MSAQLELNRLQKAWKNAKKYNKIDLVMPGLYSKLVEVKKGNFVQGTTLKSEFDTFYVDGDSKVEKQPEALSKTR